MTTPRVRGPYAKTKARQEAILASATEAFAAKGFERASLQEIAAEVGLTQSGLKHHFATKEALLHAVLLEKDAASLAAFHEAGDEHALEGFRDIVRDNVGHASRVRLYTTLAVESLATDHPAHQYFLRRYDVARRLLADWLTRAQEADEVRRDIDPRHLAVLAVAVMDGLQVQWLQDEAFDMLFYFERFLALLDGSPCSEPAPRRTEEQAAEPARRRRRR